MSIKLLDCTLRDGAYINNAEFGKPAMRGIISKLQDAHTDIIEIGWLKNAEYNNDTTYFHVPSDAEAYITDIVMMRLCLVSSGHLRQLI